MGVVNIHHKFPKSGGPSPASSLGHLKTAGSSRNAVATVRLPTNGHSVVDQGRPSNGHERPTNGQGRPTNGHSGRPPVNGNHPHSMVDEAAMENAAGGSPWRTVPTGNATNASGQTTPIKKSLRGTPRTGVKGENGSGAYAASGNGDKVNGGGTYNTGVNGDRINGAGTCQGSNGHRINGGGTYDGNNGHRINGGGCALAEGGDGLYGVGSNGCGGLYIYGTNGSGINGLLNGSCVDEDEEENSLHEKGKDFFCTKYNTKNYIYYCIIYSCKKLPVICLFLDCLKFLLVIFFKSLALIKHSVGDLALLGFDSIKSQSMIWL